MLQENAEGLDLFEIRALFKVVAQDQISVHLDVAAWDDSPVVLDPVARERAYSSQYRHRLQHVYFPQPIDILAPRLNIHVFITLCIRTSLSVHQLQR